MIKINVDDTVENADWPKRTNDIMGTPGFGEKVNTPKKKGRVKTASPAVAKVLDKTAGE